MWLSRSPGLIPLCLPMHTWNSRAKLLAHEIQPCSPLSPIQSISKHGRTLEKIPFPSSWDYVNSTYILKGSFGNKIHAFTQLSTFPSLPLMQVSGLVEGLKMSSRILENTCLLVKQKYVPPFCPPLRKVSLETYTNQCQMPGSQEVML